MPLPSILNETSPPILNESHLTPATTSPSPFLPNTQIQYAWDSTSLGLLKTCPRLYQYTMIEGYQTRDESIHLRFGIEYHAALESFDHSLTAHISREEAIHRMVGGTVQRTWNWDPDRSSRAGKYKNRDTLLGLLVDYVDHFDPDPATTYIKSDGTPAVELSFRFELDFGPATQPIAKRTNTWSDGPDGYATPVIEDLPYTPYLLCGHLDRVVEFNSQLFVMDRKTTTTTLGPHYFSQYNPHNQMSLYTYAGRLILNAPIHGVIIDAAQIKLEDPNAFARGFTFRTEAQLAEWMDDLRTTLSLAEIYATNQYWPMNDTSCDKFGGCKFREICARDPHVRPAFLKSNFDKLEEGQRWNPLKAR